MNKIRNSFFPGGLYGITPEWNDMHLLISSIQKAAKSGMTALQFRKKTNNKHKFIEQAREILAICQDLNITLIINDDWEIALEIGADGVHVGETDTSVSYIQSQTNSNFLIGASCYNSLELLTSMIKRKVSYVGIGSIFLSSTKPNASKASLNHLKQVYKLIKNYQSRPSIVAIGGINCNNARQVVESGADNIAVMAGLFKTPNIEVSARFYANLFKKI
ncbi:MAG: thiamine phosphate synthase [Bordetella sp.]|nr:MAG: thiamine phosphate synthase [Bordetella sp.]